MLYNYCYFRGVQKIVCFVFCSQWQKEILKKKRLTSRKQKPGEISNFQKRWKNKEVSVCTFDFFFRIIVPNSQVCFVHCYKCISYMVGKAHLTVFF
jgi:hypothetical protein